MRFRVPASKFDWREEMAPSRSLNAVHRQAPTECQIVKGLAGPASAAGSSVDANRAMDSLRVLSDPLQQVSRAWSTTRISCSRLTI